MVQKSRFLFEIWILKANTSREENYVSNYDEAAEPLSHEQNETVDNDLQTTLIYLKSDRSPEIENDISQDQTKLHENKENKQVASLFTSSSSY